MNIGITGHTSGIGKALYDYFSENNIVKGFSRSNGYNIALESDRKRIINESIDCDIFVNNAYNNYDDSQLYMLQNIFESWAGDRNKIIINISSRWTEANNIYSKSKKKLDDYCNHQTFVYPKIINLKPGLIDTPRVAKLSGNKQDTNTLVQLLDLILKSDFGIRSVTFGL